MRPNSIRIVYMGTPEFAVEPLKALVEAGVDISAIVTAPDRPAGRGKKLRQPAVKEYAIKNLSCPVLQPEKLKDPDFVSELERLNADLFMVVAFRMLPEIVWKIPKKGTINLHASLLPDYRGAAPINWVLINGEKETGVTTFLIDKEIDTGRILLREKVKILPEETAGSLHDKLMTIGSDLVVRTVTGVMENALQPVDQEELNENAENLKKAPKIHKEDCRINWNLNHTQIINKIRGLSPFPGAFTFLEEENDKAIQVKLFGLEEAGGNEMKAEPGSINSDNKNFIEVATGSGMVKITTLQAEGKKRMEKRLQNRQK